jgi:Holliday junction resolvasome RuvABC endonuclease subunit
MTILALDLGTRSGWAMRVGLATFSGWWDFRPQRHEGGGMRFLRFRQHIGTLCAENRPDTVYYEEVRRHLGTDAAHIYGGLLATLTAWCEAERIPYEGVPVGTIKRFWTGSGNASKEEMKSACQAHGFYMTMPTNKIDDNEADALALLHWAYAERGDFKVDPPRAALAVARKGDAP